MNSPAATDALRQVKTLAQSAGALVRSGNFDDARSIYLKILDMAPFHGPALSFFAQSAYEQGELDKALAFMDKAVQGNPRNPRHYQNRAEIYKSLGQLENAIRDLDRVRSLLPDFTPPLFAKALLLRDCGEHDAAVRTAVMGWRQVPDLEMAANDVGLPESVRNAIIGCANLIRSTLLIMIDSELEAVIEQHGKASCKRIFAAVAAFTGLNTVGADRQTVVAGLSLEHLSDITEADLPSGCTIPLEKDDSLIRMVIEFARSLPIKSIDGPSGTTMKVAADSDIYRTLTSRLAGVSLIPEPDGSVSVLRASTGSHVLNSAGGENWRLTAYLPIEVSTKTMLILGQREVKPVPGKLILDNALHNQYLHVGADASALFLCFNIWHPELTAAEIAGISAVLRAIRKFDTRYRQPQAA